MQKLIDWLSSNRDLVIRRLAMAGVIVAATVLSYSVLRERAIHIGLPEWSSWFYPLIFDAFILGASRTWTNTGLSASTRRLASVATLLAIVAAVAAFVAEFWDRGLVAVLFACAIPAVLALSLVLTSRAAADRVTTVALNTTSVPLPETSGYPRVTLHSTEPGVTTNAEPVTVSFNELPETPKVIHYETFTEPASTEDRREWIRERLDNDIPTTGADVNNHFGSPRNGNRLLKQVLKERDG